MYFFISFIASFCIAYNLYLNFIFYTIQQPSSCWALQPQFYKTCHNVLTPNLTCSKSSKRSRYQGMNMLKLNVCETQATMVLHIKAQQNIILFDQSLLHIHAPNHSSKPHYNSIQLTQLNLLFHSLTFLYPLPFATLLNLRHLVFVQLGETSLTHHLNQPSSFPCFFLSSIFF